MSPNGITFCSIEYILRLTLPLISNGSSNITVQNILKSMRLFQTRSIGLPAVPVRAGIRIRLRFWETGESLKPKPDTATTG